MQVVDTELGRIGMAICWENYMPLYRQHLYNQGIQLWCAASVDAKEIWQSSMRHIAYEGRCSVQAHVSSAAVRKCIYGIPCRE
jgi:nitrilase